VGFAISTAAACDVTVGTARYSVREEKKFTVTGSAQLSLTTWDGSIEVRGWDRDEVRVEVEKSGPDQATVDRIEVKATQQGNVITIEVAKPSPMTTTGFQQSPSASFVVTVPLKSSVTARSGDGSISVERVAGKIDIDTEDGSLELDEVTGDVIGRTGDGSIQANDVTGRVAVRTGDGRIRMTGVFTGLKAETRDGSIEVVGRKDSRADDEWDISTGDGSIQLTLPSGFAADVDAHSGDGRVRVEQIQDKATAPESREEDERSKVTGKISGGGKPLRLRTGSGRITVNVG
jgi:DUF4097 and DUF4098 domain-containing protein YvlB